MAEMLEAFRAPMRRNDAAQRLDDKAPEDALQELEVFTFEQQ